jgi:Mor family transcriptional regulator
MATEARQKVANFLTDLILYTAAVVTEELGLDQNKAEDTGRKLADRLRQNYGGANVYVPKGTSLDAELRNNAIFQDFRGNNHAELARKYGCTEQHVYNVIRVITEAIRKSKQGSLFDDDQA